MKDVFTQQATFSPSCLSPAIQADTCDDVADADGSMTLTEGYRRVRRSAAMLGLAVSMGATGFLGTQAASATMSPEVSSLEAFADEPTPGPELEAPGVKHQVKEGESLWDIGQSFKIQPEAIAAANSIDASTPLHTGQLITIPSDRSAKTNDVGANLGISGQGSTDSTSSFIQQSTEAAIVKPEVESHSTFQSQNPPPLVAANTRSTSPEVQADVADVSQSIRVTPPALPSGSLSANLEDSASKAGLNLPTADVAVNPTQVVAAAQTTTGIPIAVTPPEEFAPEVVEVPASTIPSESSPLPEIPITAPVPHKTKEQEAQGTTGEAISRENLRQTGLNVPSQPVETASNTPVSIPVIPPDISDSSFTVEKPGVPLASPANPPALSTPVVLAKAPSQDVYRVQPGDTLNQIARNHGIATGELKQLNGINNPNQIKIDQALVIPKQAPSPAVETRQALFESSADEQYQNQLKAEVNQLNESLPATAPPPQIIASTPLVQEKEAEAQNPDWVASKPLPADFNQPRQDLAQLQQRYAPQNLRTKFSVPSSQIVGAAPSGVQNYNNTLQNPVGQEVSPELPPLNTPNFPQGPTQFTGYTWPAKGVLTSGYGRRWGRMHRGIDIAGPIGTPISAAASGEVIAAGWNSGGFGKLVKIRHGDGSVTYYAHNHRILVRKGDFVNKGQQVAEMGSTGRSTGPHLHFEIRPNGKSAINPMALLPRSR